MNTLPLYSIIIPAYNEEALLPKTLAAIQACMQQISDLGEIVVVDNNSTDNTAAIARQWEARVVFEPHNQIARARNAGAAQARGKYFLFIDADTTISYDLLEQTLENLKGGQCCGGGALVYFDTKVTRLARISLHLWTWLSLKCKIAAGSFLYATREAFEAIDGFDEAVYAGEELRTSQRIKRWGKARKQSFHIIPVAVVTSSRKLSWHSDIQLVTTMLMLAIFPFALRSRRLCSFWYKRPPS